YLHDFFIAEFDGALWLDCEAERRDDLLRRLSRFKLRSKVSLGPAPAGLAVALVYGSGALVRLDLSAERGAAKPLAGGIVYVDPRLAALGARAILPTDAAAALKALGIADGALADYEEQRLVNGVPDGSRDLEIEKSILLENGFDELAGVDWNKGCYMGQELTARTKYRALVKKRLLPVTVDGPLPPSGTPVTLGDQDAGEMRSGAGGHALALLRLDAVDKVAQGDGVLKAGEALLRPQFPDWLKRPQAEAT
ncbi:MAG: folate-binding protein YgfZ, partial [Alphaproteobacteria bacterium]|nr:folate-binding protein YgfZ [Alphaproteobacteria bacterium]